MSDPTLAQVLAANRGRYNAKFAEARHYQPKLEGEIFAELLRTLVAPIVEATAPEATETVTEALYDISLELLAQDFLGPNSRYPAIVSGWTHVLPKLARHLANQPRAMIGAVTNGIYNLSLTPGARPGAWMNDLLALGKVCEDTPTLLKAGQVCAWRAGLAHYRAGALALCKDLPPVVAHLALGLSADDSQPLDVLLGRLETDPWYRPGSNDIATEPQLKIVARVGAFRGFGGLFLVPPIVEPAGEGFLVTDGEGTWLLMADAFGATFQRMSRPNTQPPMETPFKINRSGTISGQRLIAPFPELAQSTSTAGNTHTFAVTVPYSHAVYLVAVAPTPTLPHLGKRQMEEGAL